MFKIKNSLLVILIFYGSIYSASANDINSVSYIYYPSSRNSNPLGHAELEVNGTSRTIIYAINDTGKNIDDMIRKSKNDGLPFFRFIFNANQKDIEFLKNNINTNKFGITCSHGALARLSETKISYVPMPLALSPLLSAIYLTICKKMQRNNVKSIEYHGHPISDRNVIQLISVGTIGEAAIVFFFVCQMFYLQELLMKTSINTFTAFINVFIESIEIIKEKLIRFRL